MKPLRIVMMGTGMFAVPTLESLLRSSHSVVGLVTQPDRVAGAERGSTRQVGRSMKEIAQTQGISVFQPESINTPEGAAHLRAFAPDLLVVAAYGQILSKDVLAVPPLGGINVHGSLLPKYRGAAPVAWAIYHGETQAGVTIIRMSTALDAGDMLAQEAIPIGPDDTAGDVEARLALVGAKLALEMVDKLAQGPVSGAKQDKALVTKAPKLTKEHGLIDWTRPAQAVCNQIRAMQPWPTAYTYLHREGQPPLRLLITKAGWRDDISWLQIVVSNGLLNSNSSLRDEAATAPPGHVLPATKKADVIPVATGNGVVLIREVQPAGKRLQSAAEFRSGYRIKPGDLFKDISDG